jgi:endonuclease YncB( thermonuclease family)
MRRLQAAFLIAWLAAASGAPPVSEARVYAAPTSRRTAARVEVDGTRLRVMDGDTMEIHWSAADVETVRVLAIDTPELFDRARRRNPAGMEARAFARGAFGAAHRVELIRAATLDRYRRTLGYFFLDGRNYSALVFRAGLARETLSRFGDNGLAREAREVRDAIRERRGR